MCLFTTYHCPWFFQRDGGRPVVPGVTGLMGRNDKLRRLPRQREAPPERWETAFRRFAKGAPWQIGVSLLKRTSKEMTYHWCIVSGCQGWVYTSGTFRFTGQHSRSASSSENHRSVEHGSQAKRRRFRLQAIRSFSVDP